jgi:hypothetical protein
MYKLLLIFVLLIFFGATALAIEPPISPTQIRDLSVQQKVTIVEKLKQIEKLAYEVSEETKGKIGVQIQFQNDEDRLYLEDFFEIYEQVQVETTIKKVLQPQATQYKVRLEAGSPQERSEFKFLYSSGYKFQMQEAANGELGDYEVLDGREVFGKGMYLVKTHEGEEIIMQESEITNWQYKKK